MYSEFRFLYTVKPVYNDHPWDPKIVVVVGRWSLFAGNLCSESYNWDLKMVVVSSGLTLILKIVTCEKCLKL